MNISRPSNSYVFLVSENVVHYQVQKFRVGTYPERSSCNVKLAISDNLNKTVSKLFYLIFISGII